MVPKMARSVGACNLGCLADGRLGQEVGEFLQRLLLEASLLPQVRCQEVVCGLQSCEGGLHEVTKSLGRTPGRGVAVVDTRHLQHLLGHTRRHNAGTTGRRDEAHRDTAALASGLRGHCVGLADLVTPVTPPHRHHRGLRQSDGAPDGHGNLLGALHAKTHVAVRVTHYDERLEAGTLSGAGLLLHGHDLHDLVLQSGAQEELHNLVLLDGHGEQEDVLQLLDLALLYKPAQLGQGHPFLLILVATTPAAATTASAVTTAAVSAVATAATAKAAVEATPLATTVRHGCRSETFKP
mmetsp:Transcript_15020/g.45364  ORF Transcript_15020/g.45364 Transcript_15020/m.45364 type:complete len:295 (-) Transcript_15020:22-906(-)